MRAGNFWNKNYIEYESNGDRNWKRITQRILRLKLNLIWEIY